MCAQANYSKYQRRVIKFLTELLGGETPFTYERAQNNHLKVLIEGVPKPMFTGSTPSDSKSLNNFMAEVKREVRASKQKQNDVMEVSMPTLANPMQTSHERLIQNTVKSLRTRLDALKSKEEAKVLEQKSVEGIASHRVQTVKHALSLILQARKNGVYLKPKEMKGLEEKIGQHLDFMLPTVAHYAELLEAKQRYKKAKAHGQYSSFQQQIHTSNVINLEEKTKNVRSSTVKTSSTPCVSVNTTTNSMINQHINSAAELMGMSANNRISLLRQLTKRQALMLIDDLNTAIAENMEEDIEKVVALIQEKNLPIETIISRIDAA